MEEPPYEKVGEYVDRDGRERAIVIDREPPEGYLRVLDLGAAEETLLVARLDRYEDTKTLARAVAADYLQQIRLYLAGERDALPCPHPIGLEPRHVTLNDTVVVAPARIGRPAVRRRRRGEPDEGQDALPLLA
jgi:hypothetical protein